MKIIEENIMTKTTAIILAGGIGSRMDQAIPKQFLHINNKPLIIYTLEAFQNHPMIDNICVVTLEGWEPILNAYAKQYGITKLKKTTIGGNTGQESIRNGINSLVELEINADDIVIIHDGIRPLIDEFVLSDVIIKCKKFGNAVSSLPYNEQIFKIDNEESTIEYIPRETLRRVSTPQGYKYGKLKWAYDYAFENKIGIYGSHYTNTMMVELGERLYFSAGSDKNIKITTKDDMELFKAYLDMGKKYD
jgi:2-C-methyl-D-erythritol 4-phosphate cytidylyltransferase